MGLEFDLKNALMSKLNGNNFSNKDELIEEDCLEKNEHKLVFKIEKRRNKIVTLVGKFYLNKEDKKELLSFLKKKLSCGGTFKNEWIEIQGDVKNKLKEILLKENWKFKH